MVFREEWVAGLAPPFPPPQPCDGLQTCGARRRRFRSDLRASVFAGVLPRGGSSDRLGDCCPTWEGPWRARLLHEVRCSGRAVTSPLFLSLVADGHPLRSLREGGEGRPALRPSSFCLLRHATLPVRPRSCCVLPPSGPKASRVGIGSSPQPRVRGSRCFRLHFRLVPRTPISRALCNRRRGAGRRLPLSRSQPSTSASR